MSKLFTCIVIAGSGDLETGFMCNLMQFGIRISDIYIYKEIISQKSGLHYVDLQVEMEHVTRRYRNIINIRGGLMPLYHYKVDYFSITAHIKVFYSGYTTAICQQLFLFKEQQIKMLSFYCCIFPLDFLPNLVQLPPTSLLSPIE